MGIWAVSVRQVEVLSTVHHQHRLFHARSEVHRIGFRRDRPGFKAAREEHSGLEPRLNRRVHRTKLRTEAQAIERDARAIEVGPTLQIVDRPTDVLTTLNADLAKKVRASLVSAPLVGLLIDRKCGCTTAANDEVQPLQDVGFAARRSPNGIGAGKVHNRLIRWLGIAREDNDQRQTLFAVCGRQRNSLNDARRVTLVLLVNPRIQGAGIVVVEPTVRFVNFITDRLQLRNVAGERDNRILQRGIHRGRLLDAAKSEASAAFEC